VGALTTRLNECSEPAQQSVSTWFRLDRLEPCELVLEDLDGLFDAFDPLVVSSLQANAHSPGAWPKADHDHADGGNEQELFNGLNRHQPEDIAPNAAKSKEFMSLKRRSMTGR
jgi:hypothetical protein